MESHICLTERKEDYPMSSKAFEYAFAHTLGFEGGYVFDPLDAGGETKYGISKRQYPDEDIKNLTKERAKEIYWNDYWKKLQLERLNSVALQMEMFDNAVNIGPQTSVKFLQGALYLLGKTIAVDGKMGPETIETANRYGEKEVLLKMVNVLQGMYYLLGAANVNEVIEMIKHRHRYSKRFIKGWLSRVSL